MFVALPSSKNSIMKKLRGQNVTDKILDTAERLFYHQGYNLTGINQVIAEADIAKASLYKHFESKADLMVAYIERFRGEWFENLQTRVDKAKDPKQKLLSIFDHLSERQQFREYRGCPFIKANTEAGQSEPRVLAEIQRMKLQLKSFIVKLVSGSEHKKLLSDKELSEMIFLLLEGGVTAAAVFKTADDLQAARGIIEKFL